MEVILFLKKNNQFSVECKTNIAADCFKKGQYFNSEEEAEDWVERECWIFSGEGWICNKCHDQLMGNLKKHRKNQGKGIDGLNHEVQGLDGLDNDLEGGIDTVR